MNAPRGIKAQLICKLFDEGASGTGPICRAVGCKTASVHRVLDKYRHGWKLVMARRKVAELEAEAAQNAGAL